MFVNIVCLFGFENFISYFLMCCIIIWVKILNSVCLCEKLVVYCFCYYKILILIVSMKIFYNNLRSLFDKLGVFV